jgi:uncharacterized membrane protein (GlpM family)
MNIIAFIFENYLWTILLVGLMAFSAYTSNKLSIEKNTINFVINWLIPLVPTWALIVLYSKRLVFDGLLFDILLTVAYTFFILYFTNSFTSLKIHNYMGLLLILLGLIMFKIGV